MRRFTQILANLHRFSSISIKIQSFGPKTHLLPGGFAGCNFAPYNLHRLKPDASQNRTSIVQMRTSQNPKLDAPRATQIRATKDIIGANIKTPDLGSSLAPTSRVPTSPEPSSSSRRGLSRMSHRRCLIPRAQSHQPLKRAAAAAAALAQAAADAAAHQSVARAPMRAATINRQPSSQKGRAPDRAAAVLSCQTSLRALCRCSTQILGIEPQESKSQHPRNAVADIRFFPGAAAAAAASSASSS